MTRLLERWRHRCEPAATLEDALRRGLVRALSVMAPLVVVYAVAAGLVLAGLLPEGAAFGHPRTHDLELIPSDPAATAAHRLVVRHRCWTASEGVPADMAGKVPGHAVVVLNGHAVYDSAHVGPALDAVLNGARNGVTVYGFCR